MAFTTREWHHDHDCDIFTSCPDPSGVIFMRSESSAGESPRTSTPRFAIFPLLPKTPYSSRSLFSSSPSSSKSGLRWPVFYDVWPDLKVYSLVKNEKNSIKETFIDCSETRDFHHHCLELGFCWASSFARVFSENLTLLFQELHTVVLAIVSSQIVTLETVDQCPPCPGHCQGSHWCPYTRPSGLPSWPTRSRRLQEHYPSLPSCSALPHCRKHTLTRRKVSKVK